MRAPILSAELRRTREKQSPLIGRQGMTKAQAKAKYAEDVAKAEAEKAEQERLEKEAEEAKATANTRLLEEIRDTLKALSEKG